MIKLIGAVLVLISSAGYAGAISEKQKKHLEMLHSFLLVLGLLAEEIRYERFCLADIFLALERQYHGPAGEMMGQMAKRLKNREPESAKTVWEMTLRKNRERFMLTQEEFDVLISAGQTIGYLDTKAQENQLKLAIRRLESLCQSTEQTVYDEGEQKGTPFIRVRKTPAVEGALVVAECSPRSGAASDISEAIQALFGLDAHKIKIVEMNAVQEGS